MQNSPFLEILFIYFFGKFIQVIYQTKKEQRKKCILNIADLHGGRAKK